MRINIELAKKYLGRPYVWGGNCEAEGGYDCSGFVFQILHQSGFNVTRDTAQGYYNKFKNYEVPKKNIYTGDLLFFGKSKSKISHISIAISNTEMIESIGTKKNTKVNKGKGVTISKITRRKDLVAVCRFENTPTTAPVKPSGVIILPTPTLKRGSMGIKVERLQKFLNLNNPRVNLETDGIFGEETFKAVQLFQKNNRLPQTGVYDRVTYKKFLELKTLAGL